jgi:hypothetical protein
MERRKRTVAQLALVDPLKKEVAELHDRTNKAPGISKAILESSKSAKEPWKQRKPSGL